MVQGSLQEEEEDVFKDTEYPGCTGLIVNTLRNEEELCLLSFIEGYVRNVRAVCLIDGGSAATLVSLQFLQKSGLEVRIQDKHQLPVLSNVSGKQLQVLGFVTLHLLLDKVHLSLRCIAVDEPLPADVLIGKDAMREQRILDMNYHISVKGHKIPLLPKPSSAVSHLGKKGGAPSSRKALDDPVGHGSSVGGRSAARQGRSAARLASVETGTQEPPKDQDFCCFVGTNSECPCEITDEEGGELKEQDFSVETKSFHRLVKENEILCRIPQVGLQDHCSRQHLAELLLRYSDLFSTGKWDIKTPANVPPYTVVLKKGAKPRFQRPYRVPEADRQVMKEYLDEMIEANILTPCVSAWGSPLMLHRKKDGTMRFLTDLRHVNGNVEIHRSNLPALDYVLSTQLNAENAKYCSSLDLTQSFFQVEVNDPDKVLTISTIFGSYSMSRLPQGYACSPGYLQSIVSSVPHGIIGSDAVLLLDDILVHTATLERHMEVLEEIFKRLEQARLRLKPEKCSFCVPSLEYCGLYLHGQKAELSIQHSKISKVANWPRPTTLKEVRSFIAFCSYVRRFICGFAKVSKPLNDLLTLPVGSSITDNWSEECEQAFLHLRSAIVSDPVLRMPDHSKPFHVYCDACDFAIGYCILQEAPLPNGKTALAPVAYGSRLLSATERRYVTAEQEALGVSYALTKNRYLLLHKDFTVYTDSDCVRWALRSDQEKQSKRLGRFLLQIQDLLPLDGQLKVKHVAGLKNFSDPLSRTRFKNDSFDQAHIQACEDVQGIHAVLRSDTKAGGKLKAIQEAQRKDPEWRKLIDEVRKKGKVRKLGKNFALDNDTLVVVEEGKGSLAKKKHRYVLPKGLASFLVRDRHFQPQEGHPSEGELIKFFSQEFYIPGLTEIAHEVYKTCDICQRSRLSHSHFQAEMGHIPRSCQPNDSLSVDITGPFLGTGIQEKYGVFVIDNFSKYLWTKATALQTGKEIANFLVEIFDTYGTPRVLISDRGANLRHGIVPALCARLGVTKLETTAYHPQADGMCERAIGTIGRKLKRMVLAEKDQSKWPQLLSVATNAYNRTIHGSTGFPPSLVHLSYIPVTHREPVEPKFPPMVAHSAFVDEKLKKMEEIRVEICKTLEMKDERRKKIYDATRASKKPLPFYEGQWVLVRNEAPKGKLAVPYLGPAQIEKLTEHKANLEYISNGVTDTVTTSRLRPYYSANNLQVQNFTAPKRQESTAVSPQSDVEIDDEIQQGLTEDSPLKQAVMALEKDDNDVSFNV